MKKSFKKLAAVSLAFTAALALTFPSYAAGWVQNPQGWWWRDEVNGSPVSCWRWLDGNGDGWAECYYFDYYGYMAENTTTPDGFQVDASGAWVVDGVVQTVYQDPAAQDQKRSGWTPPRKIPLTAFLRRTIIARAPIRPLTSATAPPNSGAVTSV